MLLNEILALSSMKVHGLPLNIEVEKGKQRILKNDQGEVVYKRHMHHSYGEIKHTKGRDGDPVDVFVGPMGDRAKEVHIIHMVDLGPDKKEREDEDKCFVGFASADLAKQAFLLHYPQSFYGGMTSLPVAEFKKRLKQTQSPHTHNMLHAGGPGSGRHAMELRDKVASTPLNTLHQHFELPKDDDKYEHFYHATRTNGQVDAIKEHGVQSPNKVFLSKDEFRNRGGGGVIVRIPKGEAKEGVDRVEPGLNYREWTVKAIPPENVVRSIREVPLKSGGSISERDLVDSAQKGYKPTAQELADLPREYHGLFSPKKVSASKSITAKEAKRKFYEACMKAGLSPARFILRAAQTYGTKFSFKELLNAMAELEAANPRSSIENCPHCKSFSFRLEGDKAQRRCRGCGTVWSAKKPAYRLKAVSGVPKVQLAGKSQATLTLGATNRLFTAPIRPPVLSQGVYKR